LTRALVSPLLAGRPLDVRLETCRRVLVLRLDAIGDVALTSPFTRELRANLPDDSRVTLMVRPPCEGLARCLPGVDEVVVWDPISSGPPKVLRRHWRALRAAPRLWGHYDLAVVPRWDSDLYHAGYLGLLSGASRRVGFSEQVNARKARTDKGHDALFTHLHLDSTVRHDVEHTLSLLEFMGGTVRSDRLELTLDAGLHERAESLLRDAGWTGEPLLGLGPGAGFPTRLWPVERYRLVARRLAERWGVRPLIVGGAQDRVLARTLSDGLHDAIDLSGRATVPMTAALLARCWLFVGADSAPAHLAAAGGVPVVSVSCHPAGGASAHRNSPLRFRPWGVPARTVQPPGPSTASCGVACEVDRPHCILGVDAAAVLAASEELAGEIPPP
jgi:heptosyltransferase-2